MKNFSTFGGAIATILATASIGMGKDPAMERSSLCSANDDLGDVGAFFRRKRRSAAASRPRPAPSASRFSEPLGLGTNAFTATSGTALVLQGTPLRSFTPRKLVIDISRTGTTATGLVTITSMLVGAQNQMPTGVTSMPAAAFGPLSTSGTWNMTTCHPAVPIQMGIAISVAPTTTDRVDCSALLHGES